MTARLLVALLAATVASLSMGVVMFVVGRAICRYAEVDVWWAWTFPAMVTGFAVAHMALRRYEFPPEDGRPVS